MKTIKLANGKEEVLVDDEDFERVSKYKWFLLSKRKYALATISSHPTKNIRMHRFILNAPKGMQVDHRNGNGLDNRKENIRLATRSQNRWNTHKVRSNTGFKGVGYLPRLNTNPYQARIKINNKLIHIGYYATAKEAALSYDEKARELFGEFARTNFKRGVFDEFD